MSLAVPGLDTLELAGKRVLVREDFNVPLENGRITDDTRIAKALPNLREILARGGHPIVMSHLGRPEGEVREDMRLTPVAKRLGELLGHPVVKADDCVGAAAAGAVARAVAAGAVCLLENVRFHPEETKKHPAFAAELAQSGDVFVNDAFGSSHRDHASVCGVARLLPSAAGLLLQAELDAFARVLDDPERPLVAVLGGAKVSDKLPVVSHLVDTVDTLVIGGGMAYTFLVARGDPVGKSLVEREQVEQVRGAVARAAERGCRILLPTDHVVAERFAADAPPRTVDAIPDGWLALDVGPRTRTQYAEAIAGARTLVWNGPMGVFEWESFRAGTAAVGRAVARCKGYTVVGGGDSVAAVELLGLAEEIDHISTGGGASLELLEGRVLPGIAVLQR